MDNWSTIRESWDVRIESFTLKRRRVFILCTCAWNAWNQAIFDAMEFQRARYISISIIRVDNQSWWKFRCRKFTIIRGGLSLSTNFSIEPRHSDADRFNLKIQIWKFKFKNSNLKIQIWKFKFKNSNLKIQIWKFKFENLKLQIWKFKFKNSNLKIQIKKFKFENSNLKIQIWKFKFKNSNLKI